VISVIGNVTAGELAIMESDKMSPMSTSQTIKAILTDVQFWVPALVLAAGIVLLVLLH
jgi:hypothetical protein